MRYISNRNLLYAVKLSYLYFRDVFYHVGIEISTFFCGFNFLVKPLGDEIGMLAALSFSRSKLTPCVINEVVGVITNYLFLRGMWYVFHNFV